MKYSRKDYKKLAKKPKPPKHRNVKVHACPVCWTELTPDSMRCRYGHRFVGKEIKIFDSRAEHAYGLTLKNLRRISGLQHHKKWVVRPAEYLNMHPPITLGSLTFRSASYITKQKHKKIAPAQTYEADYSYRDATGREVVIDVKGLDRKTGMPRLIGTGFKKKCRRMKLIYSIDVQVYAGGMLWQWDEKFRKLEVKK